MSLFADSSPSPEGKHHGLNSHSFQINAKIPEDANSHFLLTCEAPANVRVPHYKSDHIKPIGSRILRNPDETNYGEAIAAVPLRCIPLSNEQQDYAKSIGVEENNAYDGGRDRGLQGEKWTADLRKLEELVAQAKECISFHSEKHTSESDLDEGYPAKRIKLENECSKMVNEVEASGVVNELDDDDVVLILSPQPQEWNASTSFLMERTGDDKASTGKTETKLEHSSTGCLGCSFGGMDTDEHYKDVSHLDQIEIKGGFRDYPDCAYSCIKIQDELLTTLRINDSRDLVDYGDELVDGVAESDFELKYSKFINTSDSQHDEPERSKVMRALNWLEEKYKELSQENLMQSNEGKGGKQLHLVAAECLKSTGMWIFVDKAFGRVPGIEIGDEFRFRSELAVVGIHRQLVCGIDYVVLDGKKFATSVVNSGRYSNQAKSCDVLIYSGQGGSSKICDRAVDQKLEKGNAALVNSMKMKFPIRVTNKTKISGNGKSSKYVYDGLYTVHTFWQERGKENGNLVFKFELHRMAGQSRLCEVNAKSRKVTRGAYLIVNDASEGKEKFPIHAINEVDDHNPQPFIYVDKIVYPNWYQLNAPTGCDCINGCSDSQQCACVMKNDGEIPFNEEGNIIRAKPIVHECGPSCKCPPSCVNRVSQHGPRYQLDIFKTASRGWGVRSRSSISSGSFICEYIGELLSDEEAERRVGNDEYLFDIFDTEDGGGFAIDAKSLGNVGRFINHSCSPNLYAQEVLYDHDDRRIPHIMFFSTKNIPPLQELTYDYNYKKVCDVNGNAKIKECFCGSNKCTGRMY